MQTLYSPGQSAARAGTYLDHFQVKTPFFQAQTSPSTKRSKKIMMATNAPTGRPPKATANGKRKIVSTSKIRKMIP
jgi:hypothetical protein